MSACSPLNTPNQQTTLIVETMMPIASTETTVPKIHWALASRHFPIKKTSQALWPRARQLKVWPQCTRGLWTLSSTHSRPHHLQPWQKGSIGDLGNYETWVKHWEDWGSLPNFFQVAFFAKNLNQSVYSSGPGNQGTQIRCVSTIDGANQHKPGKRWCIRPWPAWISWPNYQLSRLQPTWSTLPGCRPKP